MFMDLLVGTVISLFVGAAGVVMMQTNYIAGAAISGQNNVNAVTRVQMDSLADSLRNAQIGPTQTAVTAASISDITFNIDSAGDTARYWLNTTVSPAQLMRAQTNSGVTATAKVVGTGVTSLQFTYYPSGGWATTLSPNYPSTSELPTISAVGITVQMTINGYTSTLVSLVRLRNSPYVSPSP